MYLEGTSKFAHKIHSRTTIPLWMLKSADIGMGGGQCSTTISLLRRPPRCDQKPLPVGLPTSQSTSGCELSAADVKPVHKEAPVESTDGGGG